MAIKKQIRITRLLQHKNLDDAIKYLQELQKECGNGKIHIVPLLSGGPKYFQRYNGKVKVVLEVEDKENGN